MKKTLLSIAMICMLTAVELSGTGLFAVKSYASEENPGADPVAEESADQQQAESAAAAEENVVQTEVSVPEILGGVQMTQRHSLRCGSN